MVKDFLIEHMRKHEEAVIYDEGQRYTYKEFVEKVRSIGSRLNNCGMSDGKCCVLCQSSLFTALGIFSAWEAGMIPVPMSLQYGTQHCLNIVAEVEPDILITDLDELPIAVSCSIFSLKDMCYRTVGSIKALEPELQEIAVILNTSGTTGKPKGVMITGSGLIQNVEAIGEYFKLSSRDTIMIARPLYHCAVFTGEFLLALYQGVNIFFYSGEYNPIAVYKQLLLQEITVMCGTPTLLNQMARIRKKDLKECALRVVALSGECLSGSIAQKIREAFPDVAIYNVYGLTEASPRVSYLPPEMFDEVPESVGFPLKGITIRITDSAGQELPVRAQGRICVHTPSVMRGYYRREQATRAKVVDGWLNTGDIGYKDEKGRLYILSREDDMIIKAGMNIYPKEIENIVNEIQEIRECVAYGIREASGTIIGLKVALNDGVDWDLKRLSMELSQKLPLYMLPGKLAIVDRLPRNASGKLIRREAAL